MLRSVVKHDDDLERRVADMFRRAGWKVRRQLDAGGFKADLAVQRDDHKYLVQLKSAPEGRPDRLIPLLAMAILQAQAIARRTREKAVPLAIVGTSRAGESITGQMERFALQYAPGVAVGIVDLEGFRWFHGPGLESLNASPERASQRLRLRTQEAHLFSDLNQWMLKVLLAPRIPPDLMSAPRAEFRNVSQLAAAAQVSLMSASRLTRQLRAEGFLDRSASVLRLVRLDELFRRWQAANLRPARELGMHWVLRGDPARQIHDALRLHAREQSAPPAKPGRNRTPATRACLALFAASDALGLGHVSGVAPHIYLETFAAEVLRELGLSLEASSSAPDVYVRVPAAPDSVFRGAVARNGVPVCDALQVWLDASAYPARGMEQAELIYRVLRPMLEKGAR